MHELFVYYMYISTILIIKLRLPNSRIIMWLYCRLDIDVLILSQDVLAISRPRIQSCTVDEINSISLCGFVTLLVFNYIHGLASAELCIRNELCTSGVIFLRMQRFTYTNIGNPHA